MARKKESQDNEHRRIQAKTYTYRKDDQGKQVLVKRDSPEYVQDQTFSDLRKRLIDESKGVKGTNVKLSRKYETVRVATPRKIKYLYQENPDGTYTRTYFSYEPRNRK